MDDDEPLMALMGALSSLAEGGKYSDLTIVCGNETYRVHKAVLCTRSPFFAKACDGNFKEAHTGVIDLSENDPLAVKMMMYYFYHLDYPHIPLCEQGHQKSIAPREAVQIEGPDDPSTALAKVKEPGHIVVLKKPTSYKFGKSRVQSDFAAIDSRDPNLTIHANVYALGEQYAMDDLKALALQKFTTESKCHWYTENFLQAAEIVYSSTPDHDRGLRDVVRAVAFKHRVPLMQDLMFKSSLRAIPDLAYDMLMNLFPPR